MSATVTPLPGMWARVLNVAAAAHGARRLTRAQIAILNKLEAQEAPAHENHTDRASAR